MTCSLDRTTSWQSAHYEIEPQGNPYDHIRKKRSRRQKIPSTEGAIVTDRETDMHVRRDTRIGNAWTSGLLRSAGRLLSFSLRTWGDQKTFTPNTKKSNKRSQRSPWIAMDRCVLQYLWREALFKWKTKEYSHNSRPVVFFGSLSMRLQRKKPKQKWCLRINQHELKCEPLIARLVIYFRHLVDALVEMIA